MGLGTEEKALVNWSSIPHWMQVSYGVWARYVGFESKESGVLMTWQQQVRSNNFYVELLYGRGDTDHFMRRDHECDKENRE